jgi:protein-tyrosine-phosphatase
MTQNHRDALAAEFPQHRSKIHLMSEIEGRAYDISDPYGGIFSEYQVCAQKLAELIELGYEKIKQWAL